MTLLLLVFFAQLITAQPKSVGLSVSYYGLSANYTHFANSSRAFHSTEVRIDYDGLFQGKVILPGGSAAYHYDFLHTFSMKNGGNLGIYAGPGARAGWVRDGKNGFGLMFGLSVEAGIEYSAPLLPISIGARMSPSMGFHMHTLGTDIKHWELGAYKNGFTGCLAPELTIRYEFGRSGETSALAEALREQADNQDKKPKVRFTFGAETIYQLYFVHYVRSNFYDDDGIRHYGSGFRGGVQQDMSVLLNCGIDIGRHFNASLASGYTTVSRKSVSAIPVIARLSVYYSNFKSSRGCIFNYIEGGPAFSLIKHFYDTPFQFGIGGGCRIILDRHSRLDFKMSFCGSYCSPHLKSSNDAVLSREVALGLSFGTAFIF